MGRDKLPKEEKKIYFGAMAQELVIKALGGKKETKKIAENAIIKAYNESKK